MKDVVDKECESDGPGEKYEVQGMGWVCDVGFFFFQAEDGIRDLVRSRGLGDVYKRQGRNACHVCLLGDDGDARESSPERGNVP